MDHNNADDPNNNVLGTEADAAGPEYSSTSSSLEEVENTGKIEDTAPQKNKIPFLKRWFKGMNVYLMLFILLLVFAAIIATVVYLSSKKAADSSTPGQTLSQDALQQLATSDVAVGQPKQTLSVQSNAVFAGKVLVRDSLEVAGTIQVGGALNVPGITVSGNSVFEQIQINKGLSVAGDAAFQGQMTVAKNLVVGGGGTFGGTLTAPQLNVTNLQLNGNLTFTKHLAAGGTTPSRNNGDALGGGGTTAVSGSDTAGSVNINTGNSPGAGCFLTVNFASRYNSTPRVLVTPVGAVAGNLAYYINRSTTSFSICTTNNPPGNASFGFDYFVIE